MALRVLAFARLRELLGFGERTVELGASTTLEDVYEGERDGPWRLQRALRLAAAVAE